MPVHRLIYSIFALVSCLSAFISVMFDTFHKPEYVHIKGLVFGITGVGNGLTILHSFYYSLYASPENDYMPINASYAGAILVGALYLSGLMFYIKKFPERYFPKTFDIWFNSHTIFHLFVFLAAVSHYFTLHYMFNIRNELKCIN